MKVLTSQELLEYARYKAALQSYLPKGMKAVFIEGKFKVIKEKCMKKTKLEVSEAVDRCYDTYVAAYGLQDALKIINAVQKKLKLEQKKRKEKK